MAIVEIYSDIEGPNRRIAQLQDDYPTSLVYLVDGYARMEVARIEYNGDVYATTASSDFYGQKIAEVRGDSAYASDDGGISFNFKIAEINFAGLVFGRTGHYDGTVTFSMVFAYPKRGGPRPDDKTMLGAAAALHMLDAITPDGIRKYLSQ